jgi:hypothetical protein
MALFANTLLLMIIFYETFTNSVKCFQVRIFKNFLNKTETFEQKIIDI